MVAKKGRFKKAHVTKQNAEYTLTVNTRGIIIKNEPWSALYSSATLGSQLPSSDHKDIPTPATIPLTR